MKIFPGRWALQTGALLLYSVSPGLEASDLAKASAAELSGEYRIIESSRPDGKGSYTGKVSVREQGPSVAVNWTLTSGESYTGIGIKYGDVLGVGYGDGLSGLAVYRISGGSLMAKWLLPTAPQQVGEYELVGPASLNGSYKFVNGMAGSVTITPSGDTYSIRWDLSTGSYTGVGIKMGDTLVAVSGIPGRVFGVAVYSRAGGERLQGLWAVAGQTGVGTEVLGSTSATPAKEIGKSGGATSSDSGAASVTFGGEIYRMAHNVSAPGSPTSQLREYLRSGETPDNYAKMVAFRMQDPAGSSPAEFTRGLLKRVKEEYPQAETDEIAQSGDSSTVEFLLISGKQVEYDLWHYFRTSSGLASVQFVLRNKPPYDTEEKFKTERAAHLKTWVGDAQALAPQVLRILNDTAK